MNAKVERRRIFLDAENGASVNLEQRQDGENGLPRIVGYSAVFGVDTEIKSFFGSFKERIQKGAFRRAIREKQNVRALRNHDPDNLLGTINGKTLSLREDDRGLWIEVDTPNTPLGRETTELIDRGDLGGMSFAFTIEKERWIKGNEEEGKPDLRIIQDVNLYDVGPVTYPAYEETTTDLRAAGEVYKRGMELLGKPAPEDEYINGVLDEIVEKSSEELTDKIKAAAIIIGKELGEELGEDEEDKKEEDAEDEDEFEERAEAEAEAEEAKAKADLARKEIVREKLGLEKDRNTKNYLSGK